MVLFDHNLKRSGRTEEARAAAACLVVLGGLCAITGLQAAAVSESQWFGLKHMAQYSPFYSLGGWKKTGRIEDITGVYILQTNGASDPTAKLSAAMQASVKKVAGRNNYTVPEMRFLSNYAYKLGSEGAIMPFGRTHQNSTMDVATECVCPSHPGMSQLKLPNNWGLRVPDPTKRDSRPQNGMVVVRTSWVNGPAGPSFELRHVEHLLSFGDTAGFDSQAYLTHCFLQGSPRVVESAKQWLAGYERDADDEAGKLEIQVISEAKNVKNTLLDTCPKLVSSIPSAQEQWRKVWTPAIIQRLQVSENYGLTELDIVHFSYMCAFESLATSATSPFCGLFRNSELQYIEYDGDLDKYYEHSYGAKLARTQGVGWVRELLSRLTRDRSYVDEDTTQVNHTVDLNADLFPLHHDSMMYADFTHDDQLLAVITLMVFFEDGALSTTLPCPMRTFVASKLVPFSGRLVVERIEGLFVEGWTQIMSEKYVRVLVNDQVMNLEKLCGKSNVFEKGTYCSMWQFVSVMEGLATVAAEEFKGC